MDLRKKDEPGKQAEELIFEACYSPVSIRTMLADSEGRSRIRKVAVPQLYYGAKQLGPQEIRQLLPHVTEEQWQGIMDLDLWTRDQASEQYLLKWHQSLEDVEDPVVRKLFRAVDAELWILLFRRRLGVIPISEEEEAPDLGDSNWMATPDQGFRLILPDNPEESRLIKELIERMYSLEPERTAALLLYSGIATSIEAEEECYQLRKRRIEDIGFQDYFEALSVYTEIDSEEALPEKSPVGIKEVSLLPTQLVPEFSESLLLLRALSQVGPSETQNLLEELFYICNKVLSADRVSPADSEQMKGGIRKAVMGMNLGLDWWSSGRFEKAVHGVRTHYLQSFFHLSYGVLKRLQRRAKEVAEHYSPELGSFEEAALLALVERDYPLKVELIDGKIRARFFETRDDVEEAGRLLRTWAG
jgi:hypothetical protein